MLRLNPWHVNGKWLVHTALRCPVYGTAYRWPPQFMRGAIGIPEFCALTAHQH